MYRDLGDFFKDCHRLRLVRRKPSSLTPAPPAARKDSTGLATLALTTTFSAPAAAPSASSSYTHTSTSSLMASCMRGSAVSRRKIYQPSPNETSGNYSGNPLSPPDPIHPSKNFSSFVCLVRLWRAPLFSVWVRCPSGGPCWLAVAPAPPPFRPVCAPRAVFRLVSFWVLPLSFLSFLCCCILSFFFFSWCSRFVPEECVNVRKLQWAVPPLSVADKSARDETDRDAVRSPPAWELFTRGLIPRDLIDRRIIREDEAPTYIALLLRHGYHAAKIAYSEYEALVQPYGENGDDSDQAPNSDDEMGNEAEPNRELTECTGVCCAANLAILGTAKRLTVVQPCSGCRKGRAADTIRRLRQLAQPTAPLASLIQKPAGASFGMMLSAAGGCLIVEEGSAAWVAGFRSGDELDQIILPNQHVIRGEFGEDFLGRQVSPSAILLSSLSTATPPTNFLSISCFILVASFRFLVRVWSASAPCPVFGPLPGPFPSPPGPVLFVPVFILIIAVTIALLHFLILSLSSSSYLGHLLPFLCVPDRLHYPSIRR